MEAAKASITAVYAAKVSPSPLKVPFGIALLGYRRSPDMLAPLDLDISNCKERCRASVTASLTQICHLSQGKVYQTDLEDFPFLSSDCRLPLL